MLPSRGNRLNSFQLDPGHPHVRSYPLALFFVLVAFYCFVDSLAGDARRNRPLVWFGILTSLAIASEYYAILFFLACVGALVLLGAAHPLLRGRALEWTRRNWRGLIIALGLPVAVITCFYLAHMKYHLIGPMSLASWYLPDCCWSPGTSRMAFVLRNLRADMNYMLPVEMPSAGVALGILSVFASLLLYLALFRKQSEESPASGLPGLVFLLLLAELIVLSLLRLYPFGGYARQQSILFPFFTLAAFLLLDKAIDFVPASGRLSWLRAGILAVAGVGIAVNYSSAQVKGTVFAPVTPHAGLWGSPAKPARTTAGRAGIQWVTIPGGMFTMGSDNGGSNEKPRHSVAVQAFQMAKTLVTNKQYQACVDVGVCTKAEWYGPWFVGDYQPVIGVDWEQAQVFSRWVGGRLPTEAEWEYAARSCGREQKYPWGDEAATCERAMIGDCGDRPTAPVCSKPAGNTKQGLCDMAGNVWEWVQDWYHDSYNGAPIDGSAWESPTDFFRVNRGGSWDGGTDNARSAYRRYFDPGDRLHYLGFRPARVRRD